MSDKKRRDITLGEMQDECRRFDDGLCGGKSCAYQNLCNQIKSGCTPHAWDLSNPPRFTEAQMALLKALYGIGVKKITRDGKASFHATRGEDAGDKFLGVIEMGENETLDLAELLGKDGESK